MRCAASSRTLRGRSVLRSCAWGTAALVGAVEPDAPVGSSGGGLGVGYAAMVDSALNPDVSAATYRPVNGTGVEDATLDVYRLPYHHDFFPDDGSAPGLFLEVIAAYQRLEAGLRIAPDSSIESSWTTFGVALVAGVEIPIGRGLYVRPSCMVGYAVLENEASYEGAAAEVLQPVFDGVLFDWRATGLNAGMSAGIGYRGRSDTWTIDLRGDLSYHRIDTLVVTPDAPDFSVDTGLADVDVVIGRRVAQGRCPVVLEALLGHTQFLGPDRDALGFAWFAEAGLGVRLDVGAAAWPITSLRCGGTWIFGDEVEGWSIFLSWEL